MLSIVDFVGLFVVIAVGVGVGTVIANAIVMYVLPTPSMGLDDIDLDAEMPGEAEEFQTGMETSTVSSATLTGQVGGVGAELDVDEDGTDRE